MEWNNLRAFSIEMLPSNILSSVMVVTIIISEVYNKFVMKMATTRIFVLSTAASVCMCVYVYGRRSILKNLKNIEILKY